MAFADRTDAGRQLADRLGHLHGSDAVALGLPRGGVPVAAEVASRLEIPLDVIVVRKLGVPYQPELAMGAVGEGGIRVLNDEVMRAIQITEDALAEVEASELAELKRRSASFRRGRQGVPLDGKTAIVIDDGIATGATARAACQIARANGAKKVALAVPVAPPETAHAMLEVADEVICVEKPVMLSSIGQWYDDFTQTPDDEVIRLLDQAQRAATTTDVLIDMDAVTLPGQLTMPAGATSIVIFAHGSGSSRHSPRNRYVARVQADAGIATLLFDLLTPDEAIDRANVFAIGVLADRLSGTIAWVQRHPATADLTIGLFGASTGAAAALWAASEPGSPVRAVVSRGGRPDLAADRLPEVAVPTLLVVGALDDTVLALNRRSQRQLECPNRLEVVPNATHLFDEPGTLEIVAALARDWFGQYLSDA